MNYFNNRKNVFDDTFVESISTELLTNDKPIYIFAGNDVGTVKWFTKARIYSILISNNQEISNNFVPCYKKSDDTIRGLYDIVTDTFYTNPAGTGTFEIGNNIVR